ncbi:RNA polymerase sigma factor [Paenibacillus sp. GYB006]|uniref:RNA polymerase sigma factor n=1 Tax=Paenibacillus sp. GYB006 TaxID=2994394 RepID=UPI002F96BF59
MNSIQRNSADDREQLHLDHMIQRIQQGETEPYRVIVEKYQRQIYVYCYYLLKQTEMTQDAVQDIFIKAYENIASYTRPGSFSAWLYKIAYNHCMNLNKKKFRDVELLQFFKNTYSTEMAYKKDTQSSDRLEILMDHLSFDEKHILLLRAVEDYSYDEIGQVMNIKAATARKKFERIRKKLIKRNGEGGTYEESFT